MNNIGIDFGLANSITGITLIKTDMLEGNEIIKVDNTWYCSSDIAIVLSYVMLAKLEDLCIYLVHSHKGIRELAKERYDKLNGK
jgi:hypothetical protein